MKIQRERKEKEKNKKKHGEIKQQAKNDTHDNITHGMARHGMVWDDLKRHDTEILNISMSMLSEQTQQSRGAPPRRVTAMRIGSNRFELNFSNELALTLILMLIVMLCLEDATKRQDCDGSYALMPSDILE